MAYVRNIFQIKKLFFVVKTHIYLCVRAFVHFNVGTVVIEEVNSMRVAEMSVDELKVLIKGAIMDELLEVKRRIFELETLQAVKEVKEGKVKTYDTVEKMLKDMEKNEI